MEILDYLNEKEPDDVIRSSIHSQVLSLKELLDDKKNFKEKNDWKKTSFVTSGEEDT